MICNSAEDGRSHCINCAFTCVILVRSELLLAAQLGRSLLEKNEELSRVIADQKFQLSDKDLEISVRFEN